MVRHGCLNMKKIKLVYNLIGKYGPGNNALRSDVDMLNYVDKNKSIFMVNSHLQNILNFNNTDMFELCTPYSLRADDYFLYELPWDIRYHTTTLFEEMAGVVLNGIRHGNGYFVVNDSVDPLEIHRIRELLVATDQHEIPRHKIIFLTGAIDVEQTDNEWGIKIIVADWNETVISSNAANFKDVNRDLPKLNTFICLNRMWQHHRVHLLWKLWKYDLLKYFGISFLKTEPNTNASYTDKLPEFASNFFTQEELRGVEQDAKEIDKLLPLVVDDISKLTVHQSHSYLEEHTRYYFYLVPETTFYNWQLDYFRGVHASEKVFKPILYRMPFIVMGPAGVLKALRKKGYMTFGNIIDESYDEIKDDRDRFAAIMRLIEDISKKTPAELDKMSRAAEEITEFNFRRLQVRGNLAQEELIDKFLDLFEIYRY